MILHKLRLSAIMNIITDYEFIYGKLEQYHATHPTSDLFKPIQANSTLSTPLYDYTLTQP